MTFKLLCLLVLTAVVAAQNCNSRQDARNGECVCKSGLKTKEGNCVVAPEIVTSTMTNATMMTLQADQVVFQSWDDETNSLHQRDVLAELDALEEGVSGNTQTQIDQLSNSVQSIQDDFATQSDLTSAISTSESQQENTIGSVDVAMGSLSNMLTTVSTDTAAAATAADVTTLESGLRSDVSDDIAAAEERVRVLRSTEIGVVSLELSSTKASLDDYATKADLEELNTDVTTEATSGDCDATNMDVLRYNTQTQQHEICAMSEDVYYWRAQGAPVNCLSFDGMTCQTCLDGYRVDNNRCVMVADFFHFAFDNNLHDLSPNRRHLKLGGVPNDYSFATGRDGSAAIELDGANDYLYFAEPLYFGGSLTVCADVLMKSIKPWSRLLDFATGTPSDTDNVVNNNLLIAQEGDSFTLNIGNYHGGDARGLSIENFWAPALGAWAEMCFTIADNGDVKAYRNGELQGSGNIRPVLFVERAASYIGRSNWVNDGYGDVVLDNVRMWTRELSGAVIQSNYAQGLPERDWKGLYGAFHLDGTLKDAGAAKWPATVNNALPFNLWRIDGAEGTGYADFDGNDDLISLNNRWFGGAFSVCLHARYNRFTKWTRLFHFFTAENTDEIQLFNRDDSSDIFFEIKNSATGSDLQLAGGFAPAQGAFQHICVTMDADGQAYIYRQGMEVASKANMELPRNGVRANCWLAQTRKNDVDPNLDGALDDFRVYDRALSAAEVQDVLCQGRPALDCVGLLGHYRFDGDARDSSANAWHGSVVASNAQAMHQFFSNNSVVGSGAATFEGTDGFIRLPARNLGGAFSLTVWIKVVAAQEWARIIDFGNGASSNNFYIARASAAATNLHVESRDNGVVTAVDFFKDKLNQWIHVGVSIAADGSAKIYSDGVVVQTAPADSISIPQGMRANCYVAESNWDNDQSTNGHLDDLRMYNRALSDAEVLALYNLGNVQ